jgi:hypothetical protein
MTDSFLMSLFTRLPGCHPPPVYHWLFYTAFSLHRGSGITCKQVNIV